MFHILGISLRIKVSLCFCCIPNEWTTLWNLYPSNLVVKQQYFVAEGPVKDVAISFYLCCMKHSNYNLVFWSEQKIITCFKLRFFILGDRVLIVQYIQRNTFCCHIKHSVGFICSIVCVFSHLLLSLCQAFHP